MTRECENKVALKDAWKELEMVTEPGESGSWEVTWWRRQSFVDLQAFKAVSSKRLCMEGNC